jgi:hypothetical protein
MRTPSCYKTLHSALIQWFKDSAFILNRRFALAVLVLGRSNKFLQGLLACRVLLHSQIYTHMSSFTASSWGFQNRRTFIPPSPSVFCTKFRKTDSEQEIRKWALKAMKIVPRNRQQACSLYLVIQISIFGSSSATCRYCLIGFFAGIPGV